MTLVLIGGAVFGVIIVGAVAVMAISIYNGLVSLRNQIDRSWANIDVILKQRHDEIPNLISVCEQFAGYERATLDRLVKARAHYGTATSMDDKIKASGEVTKALTGIFALGEAYPQLKSSDNFIQLQNRISQLEDSIADRREHFNETVTNYNTRILQFPDLFFANMLGYRAHELFKVESHERVAPSVKMKLPA